MTTAWSTEHLVTLPSIIDGDMLLLDRQATPQPGSRARPWVTPSSAFAAAYFGWV